jgi:hypothetical protein
VAIALKTFPKIAHDPIRLLQRGRSRIDESLSPNDRYTRHNGPGVANLSFVDYPPLGFCCVDFTLVFRPCLPDEFMIEFPV